MIQPTILPLLILALLPLGLARAGSESYPYQSCFEIASKLHQVPVDLLLAVAATESAWDPDARSHANAHGIMQIQWPGTARHLGVRRVSELYNPCLNIALGARYLRELLDANHGDVERSLAAYNYGPGRISRSETLPDGARRYAQKVASHQARIGAGSEVRGATLARVGSITFDSATRARRFAESLNKKIDNATFTTERSGDGSHRVRMIPASEGLSVSDVVTLEALGWTNIGIGDGK